METRLYRMTAEDVICNHFEDVAVTSTGKVHFTFLRESWSGYTRVYATNQSGAWSARYSIAAAHQSLYEDISKVQVAHHNGTTRLLYVVLGAYDVPNGIYLRTYRSDGSSSVSHLPQLKASFSNLDLAIDGAGKLHVVADFYSWPDSGIAYLTNKTGPWTSSTIRSGGGYHWYGPSLALDPNGKVHAVFGRGKADDDRVIYATNASGSWAAKLISTREGVEPAIAYSSGVHIAYTGFNAEGWLSMYYTTNMGGSWSGQRWDVPFPGDTVQYLKALDITAGGGHPYLLFNLTETDPGWYSFLGVKTN